MGCALHFGLFRMPHLPASQLLVLASQSSGTSTLHSVMGLGVRLEEIDSIGSVWEHAGDRISTFPIWLLSRAEWTLPNTSALS